MPAPRLADVARDLERLLEPALAAAGFDLEEVTVAAAGRRSVVRVVVDRDGGIDLDAVAEASRTAGDVLDADEGADSVLPGAYTLEVTSPGVDRPLTEPRHWRRARTRLVTARLHAGDDVTGRVLEAGEDCAVLEVDGTRRTLAFDEVARAQVQVEFRRPDEPDHESEQSS